MKYKDHLDNEYDTLEEMLANWNMPKKFYNNRKKRGLSGEECLTGDIKIPGVQDTKDHLGRTYYSESDMARHWGLKPSTYKGRRNLGYSIEDALTTDTSIFVNSTRVEDPAGNKFPSVRDMCEYHGVNYETYRKNISDGMPMEYCLINHKKELDKNGRPLKHIMGKPIGSKNKKSKNQDKNTENTEILDAKNTKNQELKESKRTEIKEESKNIESRVYKNNKNQKITKSKFYVNSKKSRK